MQGPHLLLSIQYDRPQAFDFFQPPMNLLQASSAYQNDSNSSFLQFDLASETLDIILACPREASSCSAILAAVDGIFLTAVLGLDEYVFEEQGGAAGFAEAIALYLNISSDFIVQVLDPDKTFGGLATMGRYHPLAGGHTFLYTLV